MPRASGPFSTMMSIRRRSWRPSAIRRSTKDNLQFNATATDPAAPRRSRSLARTARAGSADRRHYRCWAGTGRFTWTPTEAQGPGSYTFDVVVTDSGNNCIE